MLEQMRQCLELLRRHVLHHAAADPRGAQQAHGNVLMEHPEEESVGLPPSESFRAVKQKGFCLRVGHSLQKIQLHLRLDVLFLPCQRTGKLEDGDAGQAVVLKEHFALLAQNLLSAAEQRRGALAAHAVQSFDGGSIGFERQQRRDQGCDAVAQRTHQIVARKFTGRPAARGE